jgi:hypothetical protein
MSTSIFANQWCAAGFFACEQTAWDIFMGDWDNLDWTGYMDALDDCIVGEMACNAR